MSLHPLAQLGQLALALGLGAVLGLLFDVLRVPRRHARRAFTRAVLDTVLCLSVGLVVFAFGMAAGSGQLDGLFCLGQRAGFAAAGEILPPLRAKNAQNHGPRTKNRKKSLDFCKKTLPKSPQMF